MTQSANAGRYPDAFPSPTRYERAAPMNAAQKERYAEFWDAGTEEDERRAEAERIADEEWLADYDLAFPTRPRDADLLPREELK